MLLKYTTFRTMFYDRLSGTGGYYLNQYTYQVCTVSLSCVGAGRAKRLFGKIWLKCWLCAFCQCALQRRDGVGCNHFILIVFISLFALKVGKYINSIFAGLIVYVPEYLVINSISKVYSPLDK